MTIPSGNASPPPPKRFTIDIVYGLGLCIFVIMGLLCLFDILPIDLFAANTAGLAALIAVIHHALQREEVETVRKEAQELEGKALLQVSLVGYTVALLDAAAKRQRESVLRSERRASGLFWVSTLLMMASVVVPFALVNMYLQGDPTETVKGLVAVGIPVAEAAKAAQRDWHLLLAGVSFGLLFIAAARGILVAEGRQRDVYAREVRETAYYGDLVRALNIAQRVDSGFRDGKNTVTHDVIRKILQMLLERGSHENAPELSSPNNDSSASTIPEHEFFKLLAENIKR
jgi:hypothetical protein